MKRFVVAAVLLAACGGEPDSRHPGVESFQTPPPSFLTVCASGPTVEGIDVSHWEGTVNWAQVKAAGYGFGIAKASEGLSFTDPQFATNWPAMKGAGLVRGAYHFFQPADDGTQQADYFLARVSSFGEGDLSPILDWEVRDAGVANALQWQRVRDFADEIKANTGRTIILYTSQSFLSTVGSPTGFSDLPLWDARYGVTCPNIPDAWPTWTFWQYTGSGSAPGIPGDAGVDLNHFNGSMDDLIALTEPPAVEDAGVDAGTVEDAGTDPDVGTDGGTEVEADGGTDAGTGMDGGRGMDAGAGGPGPVAVSATGCNSTGGAWGGLSMLLTLAALAYRRSSR